MIVNVSFFAAVKDIMGTEKLELSMDDESTVGDLKQTLVEQNPALLELVEKSVFSVDQEYVNDEKQLYHGAEVGFIPPVSGG
ncbi:MAG: molybdopterin converting factor subunit 1 [Planctomycetota bacterium]|nr:molybdopterin converting factor subunit 1 [Planctomycetota bacterium]